MTRMALDMIIKDAEDKEFSDMLVEEINKVLSVRINQKSVWRMLPKLGVTEELYTKVKTDLFQNVLEDKSNFMNKTDVQQDDEYNHSCRK